MQLQELPLQLKQPAYNHLMLQEAVFLLLGCRQGLHL